MSDLYVQRDQPPGVAPLQLTGERTLPDVPEENYWFRRHLAVYEWIAERVAGLRVADLACGEGYGAAVLARAAADVVGVDANPETYEHARLRYERPNLRFARGLGPGPSGAAAHEALLRPLHPGDLRLRLQDHRRGRARAGARLPGRMPREREARGRSLIGGRARSPRRLPAARRPGPRPAQP